MITTAIIAEYNPFHKGHQYQLSEARRLTNADFLLVIMSGNFTQRGIPACFDKFTRADIAVACGADIVLELPVCYATQSAELFAEGAVSILHKLSVVDYLCFGSELSAEPSVFSEAASFFQNESALYQSKLRALLKEGISYPKARSKAAEGLLSEAALSLIQTPNSALGVEYCKALLKRKSKISLFPILRTGASYHDLSLSSERFVSASALRLLFNEKEERTEEFLSFLPAEAGKILMERALLPITERDLSLLLSYVLIRNEKKGEKSSLTVYSDISRELSSKMFSMQKTGSYEDLIEQIKTKQYTRTRLSRALLHLLLSITTSDISLFREEEAGYARVLSCSAKAAPLLKKMQLDSFIPIVSKASDQKKLTTQAQKKLFSYDLFASELYRSLVNQKHGVLLPNDFTYNVKKNLI